MMDFLKLVKEARTCRRFVESQPLTQPDLEWLVECARVSPSARNAQELRFVTITGSSACMKILALTTWAAALKDWSGPQQGERPTGFIAILKPAGTNEFIDYSVGIAAFAIQLAATTRQWGCCIIGSFNRHEVRDFVQCPDNMEVALLTGLGLAREKRVVDPVPPGGSFVYWRDENGVHHVPKRSLDELIIGRIQN